MNQNRNIIITKVLLGLATLVFSTNLLAHGGFEHVMGTVVKIEKNTLTVKTAKGDVVVKIDEKTELSKGNEKATLANLEAGARVVVDIPEGSKDKIAHSVKFGVNTTTPDTHSHK